jgi:hypothetical protein
MKWVLVLVLAGCGGVSGTTETGGTSGATGGSAAGGSTASGGGTGTGGSTVSGGATGTGGTTGTGGSAASGGTTGTGGSTASGGATGTGGTTGTGGKTGAGGAGSCLADSADCTSTPNACCSGVCLENANNPSQQHFCAAVCTIDSQCNSGCCATLTNSSIKACDARGFCPETCAVAGVACTGQGDCCANETCVTPSNTCAANCTRGAQCASGCCAALSNTSATGVCSDPIYCGA